jgi:arylsulfatase A-like enzyme
MAAHSPYSPPSEFREELVTSKGPPQQANDWQAYYANLKRFTRPQLRHLSNLYDAEIRQLDATVEQLVDLLKEAGAWPRTVFIVTSDHGENLGDHGHLDHVFSLYNSTLKVPLLVHSPAEFAAGRDQHPTQLVDVLPTLQNLLRLPSDPSTQGLDLREVGARRDRPVFAEYYRPQQALRIFRERNLLHTVESYNRPLKAVIHQQQKLIWAGDDRHELYDLNSDPGEQRNLFSGAPGEKAQALMEKLEALQQDLARQRPEMQPDDALEVLDSQTLQELRRLGYIR